MSELQTKSKHGGRRAGARRPGSAHEMVVEPDECGFDGNERK